MLGIGIFFATNNLGRYHFVVLFVAWVLTSLSTTDLFPRPVREEFLKPYLIKALPSALIWFALLVQMYFYDRWQRLGVFDQSLLET
jgi:hypothetical protein